VQLTVGVSSATGAPLSVGTGQGIVSPKLSQALSGSSSAAPSPTIEIKRAIFIGNCRVLEALPDVTVLNVTSSVIGNKCEEGVSRDISFPSLKIATNLYVTAEITYKLVLYQRRMLAKAILER